MKSLVGGIVLRSMMIKACTYILTQAASGIVAGFRYSGFKQWSGLWIFFSTAATVLYLSTTATKHQKLQKNLLKTDKENACCKL